MIPKPRMKPKFTLPLRISEEQFMARLSMLLKSNRCPAMGQVLKQHAYVALPREQRSLLSPYLNVSLRKDEQGNPIIFGRFSPHPHVWTGFMATYGAIGFLGTCGLVWGWAQTLLGESGWMMWAFPASLALIAFVWGAAVIGQGLVADQMHVLRRVVERAAGFFESSEVDEDPEQSR